MFFGFCWGILCPYVQRLFNCSFVMMHTYTHTFHTLECLCIHIFYTHMIHQWLELLHLTWNGLDPRNFSDPLRPMNWMGWVAGSPSSNTRIQFSSFICKIPIVLALNLCAYSCTLGISLGSLQCQTQRKNNIINYVSAFLRVQWLLLNFLFIHLTVYVFVCTCLGLCPPHTHELEDALEFSFQRPH